MKSTIAVPIIFCALLAANPAFAQTWMQTSANTSYTWYSIASSADGTRLAATSVPRENLKLLEVPAAGAESGVTAR